MKLSILYFHLFQYPELKWSHGKSWDFNDVSKMKRKINYITNKLYDEGFNSQIRRNESGDVTIFIDKGNFRQK